MNDRPKTAIFRGDVKARDAICELENNLPTIIAHATAVAEVKRKYFIALMGEGFSQEQALELCKHSIAL